MPPAVRVARSRSASRKTPPKQYPIFHWNHVPTDWTEWEPLIAYGLGLIGYRHIPTGQTIGP